MENDIWDFQIEMGTKSSRLHTIEHRRIEIKHFIANSIFSFANLISYFRKYS